MRVFALLSVLFCFVIPTLIAVDFVNPVTPAAGIDPFSFANFDAGKVDPALNFAPTYVQQFTPFGSNVLLSLRQGTASQYRAVVVSSAVSSLTEGATVAIDPSSGCLSTYGAVGTATALRASYPLVSDAKNAAAVGQYVNGVRLNFGLPIPIPNPGTSVVQTTNYLICPSSAILGVVTTETGGGNRAQAGTAQVIKPGRPDLNPDFWTYQ
jgi:hypothetical protein